MRVVGIDTGGTFTDMVVLDQQSGHVERFKVPSIPQDPAQALLNCFEELFQSGCTPDEISAFFHGTTIGTNLLVEGKGARVGIIVTEGFSGINDVWQVPRFGPDMYHIYVEKQPFVLPRFREEVRERVDASGKVVVPLGEESARSAVRRLAAKGVDSIAVVLLFSFLNPQHELRIGEIVREELPGCPVSLSSQVVPRMREYPRLTTTVANARLAPVFGGYLAGLEQRLRGRGVKTEQLYIMQSNGGVARIGTVVPVTTVLSGPCAGAQAGIQIGLEAGFRNVISLDMGGTSTDIALAEDGKLFEKTSGQVGDWEFAIPMLMIHTIGAGGGTVAWLDRAGGLQVGPRSAGADPGPVCYDKGGTEPTVTDANLLLGILNPGHLLGGKVPLNRGKAADAIAQLGARLGLDPLHAANGVVRVINTHMVEGVRAAAAERGYDLTTFALVAFGGAGPAHAGRLAAQLGIRKVLVPPMPGLTSALGLLLADLRRDYVRSRLRRLSELESQELNAIFADLQDQAMRDLTVDGFSEPQVRLECAMDLRYRGQGYELTVPVNADRRDGKFTQQDIQQIRRHFDEHHGELFGHSNPAEAVEAVNYRLRAHVAVPKATLRRYEKATRSVREAQIGERQVCFDVGQGRVRCPIYSRSLLGPGHSIAGPAIVEQFDSTSVIYPGQTAEVDGFTNLILTVPS